MTYLNRHVLAVCGSLPRGGGYHWPAPGGGCLRDVVHDGVTILRAGEGTYCCGLTFEVLVRAYERAGFAGLPLPLLEARQLLRDWFVAGIDRTGPQALARCGLGEIVAPADALPGDFAQFWRENGSGHSVVVCAVDDDVLRSPKLRYLSTQRTTDGIGERTERWAELYVCRAIVPEVNS